MLTIDATSKAARITPYINDDFFQNIHISGEIQTFRATSPAAGFTITGSPTDLMTFSGSPRRTVRVLSLGMSVVKSTAAAQQSVFVVRRNSANIGGTFTAVPVTEMGNARNLGSSASPVVYTANPTALGNLLGNIWTGTLAFPLISTAGIGSSDADMNGNNTNALNGINIDFVEKYGQPITLRGNQESISINMNGVAVTGMVASFYITWQETDG